MAGISVAYDLAKEVGVKNILESFFYIKNKKEMMKEMIKNHDFILDSGAFSAMTQKKYININQYIDFIKELNPPLYAGLDVIGNAEETKKNIEYMESKGLSPIPTFHRKSDFRYLYEMIDKYDYIALGGLAGLKTGRNQIMLWLDEVFKVIKDRKPDLKVHGFACSGIQVMKLYPWYSVDSSSWCAPVKFDRDIGFESTDEILDRYMKQGIDVLSDRGVRWDTLVKESLKYFMKLEDDINLHHSKSSFQRLNQGDLFI